MASTLRLGIPKLGFTNVFQTRLCKVSRNYNVIQVACMTREADRIKDRILPPPLRYWEDTWMMRYKMKRRDADIMRRFYENSKIIVIDGPPASGKAKLAEKIADEFHMLYMPAPTHDEYYINPYGFDHRSYDSKLTVNCQSIDNRKFLSNPNGPNVSWFQLMFLYMRCEQYMNALMHLLSTGQGIVLNRCAYSDMVFMDAMFSAGYVTKHIHEYYQRMRTFTVNTLLRPHLVIYLDTPVDVVKENIKKRGINYEVNSKVFTSSYLQALEKSYKSIYLERMSKSGHILIYDWTVERDAGSIVNDIEALDFEIHDVQGKFSDWVFQDAREVHHKRNEYFDKHDIFAEVQDPKTTDIPDELWLNGDDQMTLYKVQEEIESEQYEVGFNPKYDGNLLFKTSGILTPYFRRTPRDFIHRDKYMK